MSKEGVLMMHNLSYSAALSPTRSPVPLLRIIGDEEHEPNGRSPSCLDIESAKRQPPPLVTIAWKDIWVTAAASRSSANVRNGRGHRRHLLRGAAGFAEPGRIVAILGPSGAGKSVLLDTLSGRLPSTVAWTGEILVNGTKQTLTYGNSAYVTQDDVLMATLTVKEAVHYSAQLQLPKSMSMQEKRERAESTIKDMGLQDVTNTRIGGWRARGLSGGEKRRVSIAIELLTRPHLLFLDEPTSGLDSAAAFHVVNRLRHLAREGRTIIASIHQPSGDVFELFDYLYLLSNGHTVYFGATSQAPEFFSSAGFPCPSRGNPSDHYLRTINKDFESVDMEAGTQPMLKTEQVIDILVKAHIGSNLEQIMRHVDMLSKQDGPLLQAAAHPSSFFTQVNVLTIRSFKNMYRDIGYYWFRLGIYVALFTCIGTTFYKVGTTFSAIQSRASSMAFVSGFLTFMAIGGFPSFVEDIKVFQRERLNGHYGVAAFVLANTLSSAPYLLLISAFPATIAYVLVGLHPGYIHVLYYILVLYSSMLLVESLMMMVASIVPDFLSGIIVGAGIQGIFMLNGGFFRLPHDIPKPFWRYPISYMSFHTYALQGLYKNDFQGLTFESSIPGGPRLSGETILKDVFQVKNRSKWIDLLLLFAMAIFYRAVFFGVTKLIEKLAPMKNLLSRNRRGKHARRG